VLLQLLRNLFRRTHDAPSPDGRPQAGAGSDIAAATPAADQDILLRAAVDMTPAFLALLRKSSPADPGRDLPAARPGARAIVLASCDPDYFRHFALPFARSLAKNGGIDAALHLQVVDPDRWVPEEIDALMANTPALDIVWAASTMAGGSQNDAARTWYACARFLTLPVLLRRHALPVLVLDLDVLVTAPLGESLGRHEDADVVLVRNRPESPPWMRFVPSPLLVRPTPAGIAFADLVARYMAHFLGRGIAPWGLDRIGLAAAHLDAQTRAPQSRIAIDSAQDWPLGPSLDHDPAAVASPAFREHLPRLRRVFGWTLPGSDLFFPSQLAHSKILLGRPTWEGPMLEACLALCTRRRRALDIGAHVGFWSNWLAHHFDEVEAFEPQPILQECLRANVAAANLHLHPVALGNRSGTIAGAFDPGNSGMSHVVEASEGEILLERLDAYGFADVDFIKLDAEGYELFVLQGAIDTLRRNRPLVLVEQTNWNARYQLQPDAAVAFLESLGARVIRRMSRSDFLLGWEQGEGGAEAWRDPPVLAA
jgi:FkbM family methyltransferase